MSTTLKLFFVACTLFGCGGDSSPATSAGTASSNSGWKFMTEKGCVFPESVVGRAITPAQMMAEGCQKMEEKGSRMILDCRQVPDMKALFVMTNEDC